MITTTSNLCSQVTELAAQLKGKESLLRSQLQVAETATQQTETDLHLAQRGLEVLRHLSEQARAVINQTIDPLAQQGLQEIFGADARFETVFKRLPKAGFAARIVTGVGEQRGSPVATDGGSVAQIVSDAVLRPLVVCLHKGGVNRIIMLDEPWNGVDVDRAGSVGKLIQDLAEGFDVQFLVVTHEAAEVFDEYANKVIYLNRLEQEDEL